LTGASITNSGSSVLGISWEGQLPAQQKDPINLMTTTYHALSTYHLQLVEGRDFSKDFPSDTNGVILNEAAVSLMKFKEPLNQTVNFMGANRKVVGVVRNFVWGSPYEPVKPALIAYLRGWISNMPLKLNPAYPISKDLSILRQIYKEYNPEYPLEYTFADENIARKFHTERLLGNMSVIFTFLAIIVSCLGLFGLASFSASRRRKEIGIRKVLGASVTRLWADLSKEFLQLVSISFLIGSSISLIYIRAWLMKFTIHTDLSWWVFLVTFSVSLAICLATVSWQGFKAALENPVKCLRND